MTNSANYVASVNSSYCIIIGIDSKGEVCLIEWPGMPYERTPAEQVDKLCKHLKAAKRLLKHKRS